MFYNICLYYKYLKYCVNKIPLIVTTLTYQIDKEFDEILTMPNKFYELTAPNGKKVVAIFKKHIKHDYIMSYKNCWKYQHSYKWIFLGYENETILHDCKWLDFKNIYASFLYPNLATADEITIRFVADKLSPKDTLPFSLFMIR